MDRPYGLLVLEKLQNLKRETDRVARRAACDNAAAANGGFGEVFAAFRDESVLEAFEAGELLAFDSVELAERLVEQFASIARLVLEEEDLRGIVVDGEELPEHLRERLGLSVVDGEDLVAASDQAGEGVILAVAFIVIDEIDRGLLRPVSDQVFVLRLAEASPESEIVDGFQDVCLALAVVSGQVDVFWREVDFGMGIGTKVVQDELFYEHSS